MRTVALALLACAFAISADSPFVGTWAMNRSKSKLDPKAPKLDTLTIQISQDGPTLKAVATTNGKADPAMVIDGKEHVMPTTMPSLTGATHYVTTVNGNTIRTLLKKNGQTVLDRKVSLSPDGRTMNAVSEATLMDGQKLNSTIVFDKQ